MVKWLVASVVLIIFGCFALKYGREKADFLLGVIGFLFLLSSKQFEELIDKMGRLLSARFSWLVVPVKRLAPAFGYADFSLVFASLIMICAGLAESFIVVVADMAAKGFLSFNLELGGFIYLRLYIAGYLFLPPLLLAGAGYGFYRGVRDGRASFVKLLLAILWGLLAAIFLLSLIHGGFTGFEKYREISSVNPGLMPSGAESTAPAIIAGSALGFWIVYTSFAWSFSLLGRLVKALSGTHGRGDIAGGVEQQAVE